MENPATWGPVENVIHDTITQWEAADALGACGGSLEMTIANALRAAGLIDEPDTNCGDSPKHFPQLVCGLKQGHYGDHRCAEYSWED